jgi:hypothetical protein
MIYRVSQKDVYTGLIFRIIMCIHFFGVPCICTIYFYGQLTYILIKTKNICFIHFNYAQICILIKNLN